MKTKVDERDEALYGRKSRYTGKGASIENQIAECRDYLRYKHGYDKENVVVYADEGFSGGNTNRPQFQKMLQDIRSNKISTVVCYKLDRISRSVLDFCKLKEELNKYDVNFVSTSEKFDTSTPMGAAMMMIASVFAQLERDTIAERIRDNMIELAKTGRWLGGTTPTGYKSKGIETISIDGKKRKLFKLSPIKDEQDIVKLIYDKYLQFKSQTQLEAYLLQNDVKTKTGKNFRRWAIVNILTNPVYAKADNNMLNYYQEQEVDIFAEDTEFDGTRGIMAYNKTEQKLGKASKRREIAEWIISVGKHEGIIDGASWVEVQNLLSANTSKRYRRPAVNNALLSGLLRCSHCGSFMRPKLKNKKDEQGNIKFEYMCELKERSKRAKCNCKNVNGIDADKNVLQIIKGAMNPNNEVYKAIKEIAKGSFSKNNEKLNDLTLLRAAYKKNQVAIDALLDKIKFIDVEVLDDVTDEIKRRKADNKEIEEKVKEISSGDANIFENKESAELVLSVFDSYFETFDSLDLLMKRSLIKLVISSITSDGEELIVNMHGARNTKIKNEVPLGEDSK